MPPAAPPKLGQKENRRRGRSNRKPGGQDFTPESTDPAPQAPTDASADTPATKPKRTRRVGEPKPKRYPVGEKDPEQGM